jgi:hypothetical protein
MPKLDFDNQRSRTNSLLSSGLITDSVWNTQQWGFVVKYPIIRQAWNCIYLQTAETEAGNATAICSK